MGEQSVKMTFEAEGELLKFVEELNRRLKETEDAAEQAKGGTGKFDAVAKKLAATLSVGAVALKAYQFAMKGVAEATGNMMAAAKVEAVIKATGAAAGVTAQQLSAMSAEMAANTTHTGTAIQEAQSLLLTFKEISGDVFPQAMGAISDMAVMFGGLESAAMQVGKALNNPAEGLAALSRVGVKFNDEQTKVIQNLVETGDVAGAQAVILKQLESQFGGVAKAIADTPAGKLQQLKNEYANIQATLGEKLIPVLVMFQQTLNDVTTFITEHGEVIAGVAVGAMIMLNAQIITTTKSIATMTATMATNPLFLAAVGIAAGIMAVAAAVKHFSKSNEEAAIATENMGTAAVQAVAKIMSLKDVYAEVDAFLDERAGKRVSEEKKAADEIIKTHTEQTQKLMEMEYQLQEEWGKRKAYLQAINVDIASEEAKHNQTISDIRAQVTEVTNSRQTELAAHWKKVNAEHVKTYADAMEQIRTAGMSEQERELDALGKKVIEYEAAAKKIGKGTAEIEAWATSQRTAIIYRYYDEAQTAHLNYLMKIQKEEDAANKEIAEKEAQIADKQRQIMDSVTKFEVGQYEARRMAVRETLAEEIEWFADGSNERVRLEAVASEQIKEINRQETEAKKQEVDKQRQAVEAMKQREWDMWQKSIELPMAWADASISAINSVASVYANANANRMKEIDNQSRKEIDAINNSRMSNRVKAAEIDRIETEAEKATFEVATSQWKMDKAMAVVNSAAAVVKTMASVPFPANVPLAAAQGAAGVAQLAIIEQNKPKMQFGGFVPGRSWSGDQVDIRANSGEAVLTPAQQRNFMLMANGGGSGGSRSVNVGDTNIVINGNADSSTADAIGQTLAEHRQGIIELLYDAERRGEIDHSRLAFA